MFVQRLLKGVSQRIVGGSKFDEIVKMFAGHLFQSHIGSELIYGIASMFIRCIVDTKLFSDPGANSYEKEQAVKIFASRLHLNCDQQISLKIARRLIKSQLKNLKAAKKSEMRHNLRIIESVCLSLYESKVSREFAVQFTTFVARQFYDFPKKHASCMRAIRTLFESKTAQDLVIDIVDVNISMLMTHPDVEVIKEGAWDFFYNLLRSEHSQPEEVKIKLVDQFLIKLFASNLSRRGILSDICNEFFWPVFNKDIPKDLTYELCILFTRQLYKSELSPDLINEEADNFTHKLCSSVLDWNSLFDIETMFRLMINFPKDLSLKVGENYIEKLFEESAVMPDDLIADIASSFIENLYDSELPCDVTMKIASMFMKKIDEDEAMDEDTTTDIIVFLYNCFAFWCQANKEWYFNPQRGG